MIKPIYQAVRPHEQELLEFAQALEQCPEAGFREHQTRALWRQFADSHQLQYHTELNGLAPVVTLGDYERASTRILFTADLDAVGSCNHAGVLSYRHLCGHHAQSVHGLGMALVAQSHPLPQGVALRVVGCPAEECFPITPDAHEAPFVAGKQKLLHEGVFASATHVLSTHLADDTPDRTVTIAYGAHGVIWLHLTRRFDSQFENESEVREFLKKYISKYVLSTMITSDSTGWDIKLRTHRIGNTWPPDARDLINDMQSDGVSAQLITQYAPLLHDVWLRGLAKRVLKAQQGIQVRDALWLLGVTDLGDVSCYKPTLQVFIGGTSFPTHHPQFQVVDRWFAYIWPIGFMTQLITEIHHSLTIH